MIQSRFSYIQKLTAWAVLLVFTLIFIPDQLLQHMHTHVHHECSEKGVIFHPWIPDCVELGKYTFVAEVPIPLELNEKIYLHTPSYAEQKPEFVRDLRLNWIRNKAPPLTRVKSATLFTHIIFQ